MVDDFKPQQPNSDQDSLTDKPDDFQTAYDNKPETYVTPNGEPTTLETVQQQETTLKMPKKKSSAGKWLLGGLVVIDRKSTRLNSSH